MATTYKLIYNRSGRLREDGTAPLFIRVIFDRKIKYVNTDICLKPTEWSEKKKTIVKHRKALELNNCIRELITRISDYEIDCKRTGIEFNPVDVLTVSVDANFIEFMQTAINDTSFNSVGTYKNHMATLNRLIESKAIRGFEDLTLAGIERFDKFLREKKHLNVNSLNSRHKILRKYVFLALQKHFIKKDPYEHFQIPTEKYGKRKYLSMDMLNAIIDKEMPNRRLQLVKDMFVFSCFTGLSYADVQKLTPADFYKYNRTSFIITDRSKTEEESSIPLLPQASAIVEKYYDKESTSLLPILTNQRMNSYLKEIQDICGIDINITFHVARHTFATTITLEHGVPIETVSRMLGHKSLKTTQVYAKLTRKKLADDMGELMKKMEGK